MPVKGGDEIGPEPRDLAGRIREARKRRGMAQAELARRVRADPEVTEVVAQDYVSRWETGVSRTSDEIVRAIARALEVSAGWLTHGSVPGVTPPPWRHEAKNTGRPAPTFGNEATGAAERRLKSGRQPRKGRGA